MANLNLPENDNSQLLQKVTKPDGKSAGVYFLKIKKIYT